MSEAQFDPGGFYEFDLAHGAVRTRTGARVVVLSDSVVTPLVATAVQKGDLTPVRRLGRDIGQHVSDALGSSPSELAPETVLGHVSAVLALFGWGRLSFERWGEAVVVVGEGVPSLDDDNLGIAALLGGLFSALAGRDVACVPASAERFVLVDPSIAEQVWIWSKEGSELPEIIGSLTASEGA